MFKFSKRKIGEVYFHKKYIGFDPKDPDVDQMLCAMAGIPDDHREYRRNKYKPKEGSGTTCGEFHITLVSPPEMDNLLVTKGYPFDVLKGLLITRFILQGADEYIVDMSDIYQDEYPTRGEGRERATMVGVVWPKMSEVRKGLGLPYKKFHFTLGIEDIA
jgi:hypothetical protein